MRSASIASIVASATVTQRRSVRYSGLADTLKPLPGQSAGTLNVMNDIAVNPEADEERKRPAWRTEVLPKHEEHNYLATMYRWGYNSLTLFKKVNEDPGPWWNANNGGLMSNWSQIGDYAAAGLWSGVWRFTFGIGCYNLRPGEALLSAWGKRDKAGALHIDYKETLKEEPQLVMFPHTKEHLTHKRFENPKLPGFQVIDGIHGKRVMREIQYHLGQGLRFYLIDGAFGSNKDTSTAYRIITDNPTHAYFASLAAIRTKNITNYQELLLSKRVGVGPLDEWAWRRPGVVLYHTPGFDFEIPRIVEEFGGPRPRDMSLNTPKFIAFEPYSIPMKGIVSAVPRCTTMLDALAFLCGRWGYYADDHEYITLPADSVLSADGQSVTLLVHLNRVDVNGLRQSPYLWGAHHHRIADGSVARAWDVTTFSAQNAKPQKYDLVEDSYSLIQRPLSVRVGGHPVLSHRFARSRNVAEYGFKFPHAYYCDTAAAASSAGMLFKPKQTKEFARPSAFGLQSTNVVVVTDGAADAKSVPSEAAADQVVNHLATNSWLYAEPEKLKATLVKAFGSAKSVTFVDKARASELVQRLSSNGAQ